MLRGLVDGFSTACGSILCTCVNFVTRVRWICGIKSLSGWVVAGATEVAPTAEPWPVAVELSESWPVTVEEFLSDPQPAAVEAGATERQVTGKID